MDAFDAPYDISKLPLSPPPAGVTPNFSQPESRTLALYITAGICVPLILIFCVLRLYVKLHIKKQTSWNDFICLITGFCALCFIGMTLAAATGGPYGRHQWEILIGDFPRWQLQLSLAIQAAYGPIIWSIKLALFMLYLEVFGTIRWLCALVYFGAISSGLFYFSTTVAFMVMCAPRQGTSQLDYLSALASPECTKTQPLIIAMVIINVISDIYLILLPLPPVWRLKMPARRKIGVSALFFTGLVAVVASVLGLHYRLYLTRTTDNTWTVIPIWISTFVEMTAGIMVCCMPAIATFFGRFNVPARSRIVYYAQRIRQLSTPRSRSSEHDEKAVLPMTPLNKSGSFPKRSNEETDARVVWPRTEHASCL